MCAHKKTCRYVRIRPYMPSDIDSVLNLFYETVHTVNRKNYSLEQVAAWAPPDLDQASWNESLMHHYSLVAEENGRIAGFGDASPGYIDRLYVHKDFIRQQIGTRLADELEQYAVQNGEKQIFVDASVTARPFFEARGYRIVKEQQVERSGVLLTNFKMMKKV